MRFKQFFKTIIYYQVTVSVLNLAIHSNPTYHHMLSASLGFVSAV